MTMAAATYKQGIILDRLWTALLLVSSKGPREASKLTKRPTDQIFDEKKVPSDFFGKTAFHLGASTRADSARTAGDRQIHYTTVRSCIALRFLTLYTFAN